MTQDQILILVILVATIFMFAWGRWRHDMVAIAALIASVVAGLVPGETAFAGFGHPAVITVACVLVLSRGLQNSGAVDVLARRILPEGASAALSVAILTALAAGLSGFMNNVGALALLMPVAIQASRRLDVPPGRLLMPLAYGSILGGMTTLIGTPPNLIVSAFRRDALGAGFSMFDFTPVGLAVAIAGVAFIALVGWRLVPKRSRAGVEGFDAGAYLTEARVPDEAAAIGMALSEIEAALTGVQVLGLIRREVRMRAPRRTTRIQAGDLIVLEAEPEGLAKALATLGLTLSEPDEPADADATDAAQDPAEKTETDRAAAQDTDVALIELVVMPGAALIGRSARGIALRGRYQINLLAVSRQGERSIDRLQRRAVRAGDVLLMQGLPDSIALFAADFGCLPLAERTLTLPDRRMMILSVAILLAAVAAAALGLLPAAVAFAAGVLGVMATRVVPPRAVAGAIDWPVIVLLGALLPVAGAFQGTGAADLLAGLLVTEVARGMPVVALCLVLIVTMTLSDVMNNAATVAVMAPIALGIAGSLDAKPDAFLIAVAIGGSCAFLTPIGHQNNTLILGPGGFRFGDYWRLGLPLEILVTLVAVPMILLVWGL